MVGVAFIGRVGGCGFVFPMPRAQPPPSLPSGWGAVRCGPSDWHSYYKEDGVHQWSALRALCTDTDTAAAGAGGHCHRAGRQRKSDVDVEDAKVRPLHRALPKSLSCSHSADGAQGSGVRSAHTTRCLCTLNSRAACGYTGRARGSAACTAHASPMLTTRAMRGTAVVSAHAAGSEQRRAQPVQRTVRSSPLHQHPIKAQHASSYLTWHTRCTHRRRRSHLRQATLTLPLTFLSSPFSLSPRSSAPSSPRPHPTLPPPSWVRSPLWWCA